MIRAVADRLTSRTRPVYRGRHRRHRPRLARACRTGEAQSASGRQDP
ncbi:hypothetical protein [Glycomyces tarimensis]